MNVVNDTFLRSVVLNFEIFLAEFLIQDISTKALFLPLSLYLGLKHLLSTCFKLENGLPLDVWKLSFCAVADYLETKKRVRSEIGTLLRYREITCWSISQIE